MSSNEVQIAIYVLVFISTMLIIDILIRLIRSKYSYKIIKNKRLKLLNDNNISEVNLLELRRQRGLGKKGEYVIPIISLNKLILQSGINIGVKKIIFLMLTVGIISFIVVYLFDRGYIYPSISSIAIGFMLPLLWLRAMRQMRRKKIEAQLPESLDILRRSMGAGHPLSVAIALVAREMPDPIGTEFGITSDEMTFGLGLDTALNNMSARIGQADVSLLVVSVSIQSTTGGNLVELIGNLAAVVRERQTLRRKVKALSAEGKFSAIALSLLPIVLFLVLMVIAPTFYDGVWEHPLVKPMLGLAIVLMIVGDYVMYRMVNFKY